MHIIARFQPMLFRLFFISIIILYCFFFFVYLETGCRNDKFGDIAMGESVKHEGLCGEVVCQDLKGSAMVF